MSECLGDRLEYSLSVYSKIFVNCDSLLYYILEWFDILFLQCICINMHNYVNEIVYQKETNKHEQDGHQAYMW